jgi:L-ascorbate metabolism protein UlaG (beta-lactamase superfamily)
MIAAIQQARPATDEIMIWGLGQHSFAVRIGSRILWLDPFLSDWPGRLIPSPIRPVELVCGDLIFGSHDHADHIDRGAWPTLAKVSSAKFVIPALIADRLPGELGIPAERFIAVDDGQTVEVGGVRITGVAAAHERLNRDPATGHYPCLGFLIEAGGFCLYHAGDSCVYEGLLTKLKRGRPDVMFVPINGRDAQRLASGCIGNMTYQEAVDLVGETGPGLAIPAHYDMFEGNTADPQLFLDYLRVKYPAVTGRICGVGQKIVWKKGQQTQGA